MALGFLLGVTLGLSFEVAVLISVVIVAVYTVMGGSRGYSGPMYCKGY